MPRASTKRVKEPVQTTSSRTGRPRRRPFLLLATGGTAVLATLTAANLTEWGRFATAYLFVTLNFYIGVVSLVSLSLTVMAGLVSTDRIILKIGHRVLFQGIHRATAILAMVALGIHIAVKVLAAHAALGDAVVPFFSQGRSLFIGFGTIAAYLMLLSFWVGIARIRFIGRARPWLWRVLHCSAYASWLVALAHGLNAGRPAATWVVVSYLACVIGVSLALLVRLYTRFGRYAPGTRAERAIGVNAQTAVIPRFQDTRVPLAAPRSPVDVRPESSQPADLSRLDDGSYEYAPVTSPGYAPNFGQAQYGQASPASPPAPPPPPSAPPPAEYADPRYRDDLDDPAWQDEWAEAEYAEPGYPDEAYRTDTYAEEYQHDYWAEGDQSREVPLGRWTPPPGERPRLRLITNNDAPAGPRQPRSQPRGRQRGSAEDYRAG